MKFFKKINIGLVLTIIVLLAVVIYSINVENNRKNSKEDIKKACENFIEISNKYSILPTEYQVIGEDGKNVDLSAYYSEIKNELNKITTNESATNIQKNIISDNLESQLLNTSSFITEFDKKIVKITSYSFDGNQVSVTFNTKTTVKQKYQDINSETGEPIEKVKESSFDNEDESITLERKDGNWKIVCGNLSYSADNSLMYNSGYMF